MKPQRVCVVGTGDLSTRRIYPYLGPNGMRLVGACARTLSHAEEKCAVYGGSAYTDAEEMIRSEKPDAVLVCVSPVIHEEVARLCLSLGVPVYTEKPPALTAGAVLEIARESRDTGTCCMTGFKKRYAACYQEAAKWIASRGNPFSFSFDYASGRYNLDQNPGAFLHDFCIHIIDLTSWLFGRATRVAVLHRNMEAFAVSLLMENGSVGTLSLNDRRSMAVPTEECEITLENGDSMTISGSSRWRMSREGTPTTWREPPTFLSHGDSGRDTGMYTEIEAFADAVRSGVNDTQNIEASYRGLVLYEAIRQAAETGQTVTPVYESI